MKKVFKILMLVSVTLVTAMGLQSCDDDDDNSYYDDKAYAQVTLKTTPSSGQFYMQLNDSVTLIPSNIKTSPYGNKEMRAYVLYTYNDSLTGHSSSYSVDLVSVDTIRTKPMSPVIDDMAKVYGQDPLEIINSWETNCEDGYLTLRFRTYFGGVKTHSLYLVRTGDDTVELFHNANMDAKSYSADGVIAFRLNDLPDTNGQYKEFTLKWMSFSGEKSVKFKYKSRG